MIHGLQAETGCIWNSLNKANGISLSTYNESFDTYLIPNLIDVFYKIPTKNSWHPYVGAGIGGVVSLINIHDGNRTGTQNFGDSDYAFVYEAMAGLKYEFNSHFSMGIDYQFVGTSSQSWHIPELENHLSTDAIYVHTILHKCRRVY